MTPDDKCDHGNYQHTVCLQCEEDLNINNRAANKLIEVAIELKRFEAAKAAMAELVYTDGNKADIAAIAVRYADALLKELEK